MNAKPARSVDEYIAMQDDGYRAMLKKMRSTIMAVVPKAEESISYMIPAFKYIYMLVGIGVNKKYCSFYTMSPSLVKAMKDDLKDVKVSGATLHFDPGEKLPVTLIKKIVKARVIENQERAGLKELRG
ncbi:MAG TPA: DUF1801 domain-containing protein [Cyclobacteriaceae bacterium]|nr:DUF1801 domain-containing protein [Cyclobacteriaceae bacterium]